MSATTHRDRSLVPLADRLRWTQLNRLVLIALPVLAWSALPHLRTADAPAPHLAAAAMLAVVLLGTLLSLAGRRATLAVLTTGLLLDGAYLAWSFHLLGGLDGPVGFLVLVHVSAVTLLTSFRSGVKLAAWEAILLLVVVQADHEGLLGTAAAGGPVRTGDLAVLVTVLGLATLGTAAYGAANERELRRRRYDAQVLRDFAVDIESSLLAREVAERLLHLGCDDLLARRAALVLCDDDEGTLRSSAAGGLVVTLDPALAGGSGSTDGTAVWTPAGPIPATSVAARAVATRTVELVEALDPEPDGWLADVLPGAARVVVVPLAGTHQGVLLLAFGRTTGRRTLGRRRVPRRVVAAAEQAVAHAALAISRIELIGRLTAAADRDGLTGVANRRSFDATLERALAESARTGEDCSVVLVDLDHFKQLNDTFGHLAGDEALRSAATAMAAACRTEEVLARYGGEEFALVLPRTGVDQALAVAERMRAAVSTAVAARPMTASLGVASVAGHGPDLVAAADAALYRAKAAGRDRCVGAAAASRLLDVPA